MEPGVEIGFFIRERAYDEKLVYDLVESLIYIGSKYNEPREELRGTSKAFPATLEEQIKFELLEDIGAIDLIYKDIYYGLWLCPDAPSKFEDSKLGTIKLNICESALDPSWSKRELGEENAIKRCTQNAQSLIEVAKTVWNTLEPKPIYGVGDDVPEEGLSIIAPSEEEIVNLKIEPHIYWLNFYGPELIKKFGKEKLLSMPAYKVEELKDGILFIESQFPPFYMPDDTKEVYEKICRHLGWKTYYVDIFDIERWKPKIREYGAYEKEFPHINALKEYLERDIDEFRDRVEGGRVFVMFETPSTKPVPQHVKEMERWLREMEVEVKVIRW